MLVDEAERGIAGERDALARRRELRSGHEGHAGESCRGRGSGDDPVEVKIALGSVGKLVATFGRSPCSRAWTRPRCRCGNSNAASRGTAPNTGISDLLIASDTKLRWRSLPTRFSTTPAMRTLGSCVARPRTTAAAVCVAR